MANNPKHDDLIVELIEERAKLKPSHDFLRPIYYRRYGGFWLPVTNLLVFYEGEGRYRPARFKPDSNGYPGLRFRMKVITWHDLRLSGHRISFVWENGKTELEVDHMDRNRLNWYGWNLRAVDHPTNMLNLETNAQDPPLDYLLRLQDLEDEVIRTRRAAGLPELILPPGVKPRPRINEDGEEPQEEEEPRPYLENRPEDPF